MLWFSSSAYGEKWVNNECDVEFIVAMLCPNMNRVSYNPVKPSASVQEVLAMTFMSSNETWYNNGVRTTVMSQTSHGERTLRDTVLFRVRLILNWDYFSQQHVHMMIFRHVYHTLLLLFSHTKKGLNMFFMRWIESKLFKLCHWASDVFLTSLLFHSVIYWTL